LSEAANQPHSLRLLLSPIYTNSTRSKDRQPAKTAFRKGDLASGTCPSEKADLTIDSRLELARLSCTMAPAQRRHSSQTAMKTERLLARDDGLCALYVDRLSRFNRTFCRKLGASPYIRPPLNAAQALKNQTMFQALLARRCRTIKAETAPFARWERGYVYKGARPVYWCIQDQTALAEAEVEYHHHTSPSVYVKFPLRSDPALIDPALAGRKVFVVIWTTTPWTLPANLGIAVHPDFEYAAFEHEGEVYIVASDLLEAAAAV
jgi:hypothetical protein